MPLHRVPTCTQYSEGLKLPECRICQGYPDYFHNSNCIFKWNIFLSLSNNCLPVSTFINDKIGLPFSSSSQNKYFFYLDWIAFAALVQYIKLNSTVNRIYFTMLQKKNTWNSTDWILFLNRSCKRAFCGHVTFGTLQCR